MIDQRTEEWHIARAGKLTASIFGAALGLDPNTSRQALWRRLTGREDFEPGEYAQGILNYGIEHEAEAISRYEDVSGLLVFPSGSVENPQMPWMSASPDGLIGKTGAIEAKCPWSRKTPAAPPPHYLAQCHGVMECCDREWIDFFVWVPWQITVWRLFRDKALFADVILPKIEIFWKNVLDDIDPGRMKKAEKVELVHADPPWLVVEDESYWEDAP